MRILTLLVVLVLALAGWLYLNGGVPVGWFDGLLSSAAVLDAPAGADPEDGGLDADAADTVTTSDCPAIFCPGAEPCPVFCSDPECRTLTVVAGTPERATLAEMIANLHEEGRLQGWQECADAE